MTGESRWESPDMGEGQMVVSHSQDFYHGGGSVSTDDSHSVWDEACDETGNRYGSKATCALCCVRLGLIGWCVCAGISST